MNALLGAVFFHGLGILYIASPPSMTAQLKLRFTDKFESADARAESCS